MKKHAPTSGGSDGAIAAAEYRGSPLIAKIINGERVVHHLTFWTASSPTSRLLPKEPIESDRLFVS
jgi:hypothetical protein